MERHHRGKVAFIGHPADMNLYRAYIRHLRPDKTYNDKLLIKLFEWSPSYKVFEWRDLTFNQADYFDALLIMVPFLPEMRDISLKKVVQKIDDALSIASEQGCVTAALGAFTSIVLQGREQEFAGKHGLKLTSGNTLTAAVIVRSIEEAASRFHLDLPKATLGIVGASGDIGSGCVSWFGTGVKRMILTARSTGPLESLVEKKRSDVTCEVSVTADNDRAVRESDIVVFVTSSYVPMYTQDAFKPGTVVCDASAPQNVTVSSNLRDDVFIYHGGIVTLPFPLNPGFDIGLASADTFYGCQVEGILLTLYPDLPCSWGRGNITREKVALFKEKLREKNGPVVSFSMGGHVYAPAEMMRYAERLHAVRKDLAT